MKCVINLATENGWYRKGQTRLINSLNNVQFNGSMLMYKSEKEVGAPPHKDRPYAYKLYAIKKAIETGYKQILWVDASMWAVKNLNPLFEKIKKEQYVLDNSDHNVGNWSSDESLAELNIDREQAMKTPMFSAGFQGYNINEFTLKLINEYFDLVNNEGIIKGSWTNAQQEISSHPEVYGHRHDMVAGAYLTDKYKLKLNSWGANFSYVGGAYKPPTETCFFYTQGM